MKIEIQRDLCCSSGQCVLEAPTVFTQDEEGIVCLVQDPPDDRFAAEAEAAVVACPTMAIRFADPA